MLKIEQVDREAAAYCYLALEGPPYSPKDLAEAEAHQRGDYDAHVAVKAFASHRIAAEQRGHAQGAAERAELVAEVGRYRGALEPSGDTKAAYMGEFSFNIIEAIFDEDDEVFTEQQRKVYVPWTTVKEIMAAITARAAISLPRVREADEQQEDL